MKQGAVITSGLMDWEIIQQADGYGDVKVGGWFFVAGLPTVVKMSVLARVVREDDQSVVIHWTECVVDGLNFYISLRIPAGGLYRLETKLRYEGTSGLSVTRGDMVHHFGVGDVFIIAGQSNAAGRATDAVFDPPELGVHLLRPGNVWDLASHPLHETTHAVLTPEEENNNPSHSPFLAFGRRLRAALAYPIGLVPLARGGSGLWQWNPNEEGGQYRHMLQVTRSCCPRVRGVVWYQGCADAFEHKGGTYLARFARMVDCWRKDMGIPDLPFLTAQLNRCTLETSGEGDVSWGKIREAQRRAAMQIPGVYVMPTTDLSLIDCVHLCAASNVRLGGRWADMALDALYTRGLGYGAPTPTRARRVAPDRVALTVTHAAGGLRFPAAQREAVFSARDDEGLLDARGCSLQDDMILIDFPRALCPGARLHGLWRMDPALPPVSMENGLPLVSFYDMEIEEPC